LGEKFDGHVPTVNPGNLGVGVRLEAFCVGMRMVLLPPELAELGAWQATSETAIMPRAIISSANRFA
jgi:hypothetical protein